VVRRAAGRRPRAGAPPPPGAGGGCAPFSGGGGFGCPPAAVPARAGAACPPPLDRRRSDRPTADWLRDPRARDPHRAREPALGYQRIVGEITGLGPKVSATTVRKILREAGLGRLGARPGLAGRAFRRLQAHSM